MLDGGIQAWKAAGAPTTTEATAPKAASFKISERRDVLATADDVLQSLNKKEIAILDTRSRGEYFGTQCERRAAAPFLARFTLNGPTTSTPSGKFKSNADLKAMYDRAGITPDKEVISYCQGGYRAAHSYVALRLIGFPKSAQLHRFVEGMGRPHRSAHRKSASQRK